MVANRLYVYIVQQRPEGKHGCLCTMSGNVKRESTDSVSVKSVKKVV